MELEDEEDSIETDDSADEVTWETVNDGEEDDLHLTDEMQGITDNDDEDNDIICVD